MFPIDAAVMPLPSEETTPPVTKTYFDIDDPPGGFSDFTGARPGINGQRRSALGSRTTTLVSYSLTDDLWTVSLGCGSQAVTPISLTKRSIGPSSNVMPGRP